LNRPRERKFLLGRFFEENAMSEVQTNSEDMLAGYPVSALVEGDWIQAPAVEPGARRQRVQSYLQRTGLSVQAANSNLAGLAEDFRFAGRASPHFWSMLVEVDRSDSDWTNAIPIGEDGLVKVNGFWPVLCCTALCEREVYLYRFGEDPWRYAKLRFDELAMQAAQWAFGLQGFAGPQGDIRNYWILQLYRSAWTRPSVLRTDRRQRIGISDFRVSDWHYMRKGVHPMSCLSEIVSEYPKTWYACLSAGLFAASAIVVEQLASFMNDQLTARSTDIWREPRWFADRSDGEISSDRLKPCRDRGIDGKKVGKRWLYSVQSVTNFPKWSALRDRLLNACESELNRN